MIPIWNTSAGSIGTFVPGTAMFPVQLVAYPQAPAVSVSYAIINGSLPSGVTMSSLGLITGTPSTLINDSIFNFVVRATDNLNNISDRGFTIKISNVTPLWVTNQGSIGIFAASSSVTYQLIATPVLPAVTVSYTLLSGSLPSGLTVDEFGTITGNPVTVATDTQAFFVMRATDNLGNIKDRTFSMTITGIASPVFTTPSGSLLTTEDSIWIELPIPYSNPIATNTVLIRLSQGSLPPGLEINEYGLIRGYPLSPSQTDSYSQTITTATAASATANSITCFTTTNFAVDRPIVFSGSVFGGVISGKTYYIKNILNVSSFTISETVGGPAVTISTATGFMNVTLPAVTAGQATIKTYTFTLELISAAGNDQTQYSITIVNQNLPVSQGGPGSPANTRIPTILNTRPASYDITQPPGLYKYYVLPPNSQGETYSPGNNAYIGQFESDNYFSFKILGYDFDGNQLSYSFFNLPAGFTGDPDTGWVTGTTSVTLNTITEFSFRVAVSKVINPSVISPYINFSLRISSNVNGTVIWITPEDLGILYNGSASLKQVVAETPEGLELTYITSDTLPPNLRLLSNGEIAGTVAYQPETIELDQNDRTTYSFSIQAYSTQFPIISVTRTFTLTVLQEFQKPTDVLYIKCAPSIADRNLLRTLLEQPTNTSDPIIPDSYLYRPDDSNFGKSSSVIYAHAYGIDASSFDEYVAAATKNHYWRDLTLGEIETAQARDDLGNVIYEVVYSRVIDNLLNPSGISISEEIFWPRPINLNLGPWYTSVTDTYSSYGPVDSEPTYYSSLTPGTAQTLYPNSLPNMRDRIGQVLGQEYNSKILPLWMTSQQENGSTLGFVPAWVICYTKPGYASVIKSNIETKWKNEIGQPNVLNQIDFQIDRFYVGKSLTYDYEKNLPEYTILTQNVDLQAVTITVADTYLFGNQGKIKIGSEMITYSTLDRITNTLSGLKRGIDGTIPAIHQAGDPVNVDLSYWAELPSATPTPDLADSDDFYVLFPRRTILPTTTE